MVHLTRDGGESWSNVSPEHPSEAQINAIELSPHDSGTAYLAVTGYKLNDFRPYIYKTTNHGESWRRIDEGIPEETFVRVVREDPIRKGLLYAGTEAGLFVSFNDGGDWQSLQLDLPPVPITDLTIRQNNLVAATQGRGFWVLDDLFVVQQASEDLADKSLHVYTPPTTLMLPGAPSAGKFEGKNPSRDVPLYYFIRDEVEGELSIDILDGDGSVIRRLSSEESDHDRCRIANMDPRRPFEIKYPPTKKGLNKWGWNLRRENIRCIPDINIFAGFGGTRVVPGQYRARIQIGEHHDTVEFTVKQDPRSRASAADTREWGERLQEASTLMNDILARLHDLRTAREQIKALMSDRADDEDMQRMGGAAISVIDVWEARITQLKHQTYEDEDAWETMLDGQLRFLLDVIDGTGAPVTDGAMTRLSDLRAEWQIRLEELSDISDQHLRPINNWVRQQGIDFVRVP